MPYLVIHNGDDQGTNFAGGLPDLDQVVDTIQAQFQDQGNGAVIAPATFNDVRLLVAHHGSLNLVWAGHGAGNNPRGTPLTNGALPRRIAASSFRQLIEIMRPAIVIFFSCNAGLWIERQAPNLLQNYVNNPLQVTLFGSRFPLQGFLRQHVYDYLAGVRPEPLPGANVVSRTIANNRLYNGPHPGLTIRTKQLPTHSFTPGGFHEV